MILSRRSHVVIAVILFSRFAVLPSFALEGLPYTHGYCVIPWCPAVVRNVTRHFCDRVEAKRCKSAPPLKGPKSRINKKISQVQLSGYRPRYPSLVGVSLRLCCLCDIKRKKTTKLVKSQRYSSCPRGVSPNRGLLSCISTAKRTMLNSKTGLQDCLFSGSDARPSRGSSKPGRGPGHLTNTSCLRKEGVCCKPMSRPEDSRKLFSFFPHTCNRTKRANFTVKPFEVEQNHPLVLMCLTHCYQVQAKVMPSDMFGHGVCAQVSTSAASAANS